MSHLPRDAYLEAEVRTATAQRLRLMLIDGALRFARRALALWDDPSQQAACQEALVRCRDIVHELYAAIRAEQCPAGAAVKAVHLFVYQQLAIASLRHDCRRVQDAIAVLEEERETWRLVCQQMPDAPPRSDEEAGREVTARDFQPGTVPIDTASEAPRLSLEA